MKKIGILGGTFNPPHNGHLLIANEVCFALGLDEIWFMPNQEPPHKKMAGGASNKDRLKMLELAIKGNKLFKVEEIELGREGPSYTADTMKTLTSRNRDCQFYFIIGGDMVEYLPKWRNIDELVKLVSFVGVERPGYSLETPYPVTFVDIPAIDISSTAVRERLNSGKTVKYLLPDEVIRYIEEKHLYGA